MFEGRKETPPHAAGDVTPADCYQGKLTGGPQDQRPYQQLRLTLFMSQPQDVLGWDDQAYPALQPATRTGYGGSRVRMWVPLTLQLVSRHPYKWRIIPTTMARAAETICQSEAVSGKTRAVNTKPNQQPSVQLPKLNGKYLKSLPTQDAPQRSTASSIAQYAVPAVPEVEMMVVDPTEEGITTTPSAGAKPPLHRVVRRVQHALRPLASPRGQNPMLALFRPSAAWSQVYSQGADQSLSTDPATASGQEDWKQPPWG